jgi:uncharacterized protein (DUF1810 family)
VSDPYNLQRFLDAQDGVFETALAELRAGAKQSHWMWFVFPQLAGLGRSSTAQFFGISGRDEANAYLAHRVLGPRLRSAAEAIVAWSGKRSAEEILGPVDAIKLRSCLTLFSAIDGTFGQALRAFFAGPDEQTLALLRDAR